MKNFIYNDDQVKFLSIVAMVIIFFTIFMSLLMFSCTYNISLVHTEGTATDVIDTAQSPTSDLQVDIPLS